MLFTQQNKCKSKTFANLVTSWKRTAAHHHLCTCRLPGTLCGLSAVWNVCKIITSVCEIAWGVVCVKRSAKQRGWGEGSLAGKWLFPSSNYTQQTYKTSSEQNKLDFSSVKYEFVYLFICWQDTRGRCQSGLAWKHLLHLPVLSLPTSHIAAAQITDQWQGSAESWQSTTVSPGLH